jgi:hypothetical protein
MGFKLYLIHEKPLFIVCVRIRNNESFIRKDKLYYTTYKKKSYGFLKKIKKGIIKEESSMILKMAV